jgi:hypothetical protein
MQHLDIERFIEKANTVHNNKYEYKNIIWKNVGTKITIKCKEHCDFKQTPSNLKQTNGDLYDKTLERIELIKSDGHNIMTMWEHEFNNEQKI